MSFEEIHNYFDIRIALYTGFWVTDAKAAEKPLYERLILTSEQIT